MTFSSIGRMSLAMEIPEWIGGNCEQSHLLTTSFDWFTMEIPEWIGGNCEG
jgi:hypothetical protein